MYLNHSVEWNQFHFNDLSVASDSEGHRPPYSESQDFLPLDLPHGVIGGVLVYFIMYILRTTSKTMIKYDFSNTTSGRKENF